MNADPRAWNRVHSGRTPCFRFIGFTDPGCFNAGDLILRNEVG